VAVKATMLMNNTWINNLEDNTM